MAITLIDQLNAAKKELKEKCPFKKGDLIQYEHKGEVKRGRFDCVYVNNKLEVSIKVNLPVTAFIDWMGGYDYINNPDYSKIKAIVEPVDLDNMSRLDQIDWRIEKQIEQATALLSRQKARIDRIRKAYQKKCIHDWQDLGSTGDVQRHLVGESEIHAYECSRCGMQIKSA